jgi:predicted porin
MKIKIAVAAFAAAFGTPVLAQFKPVPGVEWNVYGRVYLTAESVKADGGTAPLSSRTRVSDNSSLLGVRAEKALTGGLKGWGQLETGFKADDTSGGTTGGTNNFATRNSGVGLMGDFGNVFLGRWDTPFKVTQLLSVDPFGDLTIGSPSGIAMRQLSFDVRANNILQYWSPTISGFQARLAMTSNESKSDAPGTVPPSAAGANPRLYSGSLEWTGGPFYVSYAYEKHKDQIPVSTASSTTAFLQGTDETGNGIAAKYTMGWAQISGQIGHYKRTGSDDQKSGMINFTGTSGVHQGIASYRKSKGGDVTGNEQASCDGYALAYKYLFDRNLDFIAEYVQVKNKTGGLCDFGSNGVGATSIAGGGDPKGVAAGLRYTF